MHLIGGLLGLCGAIATLAGVGIAHARLLEERINVPAVPHYYWRYRMHLTLEQLLKEDAYNKELKDYIHNSGR